jgi:glycosyltransferase involved in cell wall biosynthesis
MRIGMLADTYKPHVSGITNYIALNKRLLESAGHDVYIFTFGDTDDQDDELNVIRSPGLPLVDTGYYLGLRYHKPVRKLLYTMDIAHVHHPFVSGSLALRYCRPRNIPVVFTNHTRYDLYTQAYLPILPDAVGETAMKAYLPPFCRACDLVIAPSPGMAKVLRHFGVDSRIEVIPNGVDLKPFQTRPTTSDRSRVEIPIDAILLVYVGRLGPEKNITFLLRAFAGVIQAYKNTYLMLVGDGPERENLQDRVSDMGISQQVRFTGMIPYKDLPDYLFMADAFVTASVTEVHPLSVIEAMAAGLPVLGIQSPGVGDTVEDGVTGFLATEDIAAFTAKMMRMVMEHDLRKQMGHQSQLASANYSIEHTSKLLIQQYEQLVVQTRNRKRGVRHQLTRFLDIWRQ